MLLIWTSVNFFPLVKSYIAIMFGKGQQLFVLLEGVVDLEKSWSNSALRCNG